MTPVPAPAPDLSHIETWIFDLDDTLYPPEAEVMALVSQKMTAFVARESGLSVEDAYALQKRYLNEHGTTLAGLMAHHGINPETFLDEVHDVSLDALKPDPALTEGLKRLPGRRLVFTNGDDKHAVRVLEKLGIADLFEAIFHIASADYIPKPHPDTMARMMARHAVVARQSAFFEDRAVNLAPAHQVGLTTVLVGPHAIETTDPHIDFRTERLPPFLLAARTA
ncbi:MAG: pyrimidine 5'-nucleotidase [Asticcacaulis sp.]